MTIFIGDVHGKYRQYSRIMDKYKNTIQVGDMGVGFRRPTADPDEVSWQPNPSHKKMAEGGHRFIRGNHDNPNVCRNHSQWIKDGHIEADVMFIGGALSIDRAWRIEGYSYWLDEELSFMQLDALMTAYLEKKPKVMVTHECPEIIAARMMKKYKLELPSVTRQAFQRYWEMHQPEIWIYGHWHMSFDEVINGTRFVCLNELETKDIECNL